MIDKPFLCFLFCFFAINGLGQDKVYLQTADSLKSGRKAFCLFEDQTDKGVVLSIGDADTVADKLPDEVKVWLHRSYTKADRKEKLAEAPAFGKELILEDGRRNDPKRFERVGDKVRLTFWGDGGRDGDQMEFGPVKPRMALEGGLRLVKYPEMELYLQERDGKRELFVESGSLAATTPATLVADTASEVVIAFDGKQLKLRKGNGMSHFIMEYGGATHDLFGFYGKPSEPRVVSKKAEQGAVALLEEGIGLARYAPLRLKLRKANEVLSRGDNFPMVAEEAKTSTEVFNRILAKHPDLDASFIGGGVGNKVDPAKNPWALVRIKDRRNHPGVLLFSRNLKLPRLNRESLMKAEPVPAVIYIQGIMPNKRTRILLGSEGKSALLFTFLRCEECDLDILYP